jgi:hypothetical protein
MLAHIAHMVTCSARRRRTSGAGLYASPSIGRWQDAERRGRHGSGNVLVRDLVEKNVVLRKGKRYTARPRR